MKFQANVPFKLTKMFYEKLGEQPTDKRVLVIRDFFTAMHTSIDNAVTFITDDKDSYELFNKNVVSNDEFGNDDTAIFVDTEINKHAWKDFIKELSSMPKFDVAIMNPPYDGNLHLKILEKVIPIANKVVNISPSDYTVDLQKYFEWNKNGEIDNVLSKCTNIKTMNHRESNDLFGLGNMIGNLSIIVCQNKKINKYSIYNWWDKRCLNLYKKIRSATKINIRQSFNFHIKAEHYKPSETDVRIFRMHNIITDSAKDNILCVKGNAKEGIRFTTMNEKKNFEKSLECKIYEFFHKCANDVNPAHLPYMQDYTQPWDDKRFCEYFNITGYIDDEHAEPGSEWEIILNTMK
jgi:hypothetical protein